MATHPPPPPPRRPRVVTLQPGAAARAEARLAAQMAGKTPPTYGRAPTLMTHAELKARREHVSTQFALRSTQRQKFTASDAVDQLPPLVRPRTPTLTDPTPAPTRAQAINMSPQSSVLIGPHGSQHSLGATGAATTSPSPTATERATWWRRRAYLPVELYIAILTLVISAVNLGAIVWLVMRMRAMP